MSYFNLSRREALKLLGTPALFYTLPHSYITPTENPIVDVEKDVPDVKTVIRRRGQSEKTKISKFSDGPQNPLFRPVPIPGNTKLLNLKQPYVSEEMSRLLEFAPNEQYTAWGIPFDVSRKIICIKDTPVSVSLKPLKARWLVFLHTTDIEKPELNEFGFPPAPFRGGDRLAEHVADYVVKYSDGTEEILPIKRKHQICMFRRVLRERGSAESVPDHKPNPMRAHHEQMFISWGFSQTRATNAEWRKWINWIWAWANPHMDKPITGIEFKPISGTILIFAATAGNASSNPLRWRTRRKASVSLPKNIEFNPELDEDGLLSQIQLDLGQVISAHPQNVYPDRKWSQTDNNMVPEFSKSDILVEYTAHADANFHLLNGKIFPVSEIEKGRSSGSIKSVAQATQRVSLRVVDKKSRKPVAVKLHVHGEAGEYLPPVDRHRIPNPAWFEDYSVDFVHRGIHNCTYIPGESDLNLPFGKAYVEVSKGFEIKPLRKIVDITPETKEISIPIETVLPWRERGWVSADTHVHFLSPGSCLLEGAGEGVNVVNLLASQWGELMTNVGDFDGKTTYGSKETGGDGEFLVRVGTENRQHILGHISLLGYKGKIIAPMTTGGPAESALGDPIEILLSEWAQRCKAQDGVVIIPHFPNPRLENAACIVNGDVDGIEMTSWGNLYGGISPYSLLDWYRYLNCGYFVSAVGGTDKMSATTAVGAVRTYARIDGDNEFNYETWKAAIRKGQTFVSYGPLLEFSVEGKPPGSRMKLTASGGTLDVAWEVASVTVPMSKVELIVNGEVKESRTVHAWKDRGHWSVKIGKSSWIALLVRGHYAEKPEIISAHSSPVMVEVRGTEFFAAADAVTILDQIEGALAYLDNVGIKAEDAAYKRMRLVLESSHRELHNRMHQSGMYHKHTPSTDHPEHRKS